MTKAPTPTEMSKGQSDNTNNAIKSSITQRLRTDLGRSVGVTTATQLVWLMWFTGPTFPLPQQPCNQKDTLLDSFEAIGKCFKITICIIKRRLTRGRALHKIMLAAQSKYFSVKQLTCMNFMNKYYLNQED